MLLSLLSKRSLYDDSRDAYGFTVRPQHIHRYREYANIYKEEEEERLQKWNNFLEQQTESTNLSPNKDQSGDGDDSKEQPPGGSEGIAEVAERYSNLSRGVDFSSDKTSASGEEATIIQHEKSRDVQTWGEIRRSLDSVECMVGLRVKEGKTMKDENEQCKHNKIPLIEEGRHYGGEAGDDCKNADDHIHGDNANTSKRESSARMSPELFKKELDFLVQGGVPKDLRGEVWQAFVGVRTRRVEKYYQYLLATENNTEHAEGLNELPSGGNWTQREGKRYDLPEKLKRQIEKDLPRTFPGHPALSDKGRDSLRRVLLAYARYNPSVGYCQAMNFFAGLLLLMMPEENAFWTLVGILDDYFEGCFSEEMIESQVDQLVFEDLLRERFPKLVNHLDYLGVEVAWISGPWFLSIFVNMLPWESVLRVWDVLLYEGNRVMLFRTALALMDLYGAAIVTTKDAGDAVTLLQALAASTFDSSQLVLTACMGFLTITEDRLQELRDKHRPAILAASVEKAAGVCRKDPKGLATKLYSFKHVPKPIAKENKAEAVSGCKAGVGENSDLSTHSTNLDDILNGVAIDSEMEYLPDLQEQVIWLKAELCKLLEEKRSAMLRAEELEAAFMEMVKEDNRRELSARVEHLERDVAELRQALADKKEGENAMLKVLVKVDQEQKITEEGRVAAEEDAAALRHALDVLQEKYEKAMTSMAEMEKRVVMAESMLAATLEYESGQHKAASSPRLGRSESRGEIPIKKTSLLSFGLGWRDRNKGKASNEGAAAET